MWSVPGSKKPAGGSASSTTAPSGSSWRAGVCRPARSPRAMRLEFHPEAEWELIAAAAYYEREVPGLGARFADEVGRVIDVLQRASRDQCPCRGRPARLGLNQFHHTDLRRVTGRAADPRRRAPAPPARLLALADEAVTHRPAARSRVARVAAELRAGVARAGPPARTRAPSGIRSGRVSLPGSRSGTSPPPSVMAALRGARWAAGPSNERPWMAGSEPGHRVDLGRHAFHRGPEEAELSLAAGAGRSEAARGFRPRQSPGRIALREVICL